MAETTHFYIVSAIYNRILGYFKSKIVLSIIMYTIMKIYLRYFY
jgi:hypothetical protein